MADLGAVSVAGEPTVLEVTGYMLAGTTPPATGPAVPTTGQIWPRGNP